ncbi:MAG: CoA ester lyase [Rhizobiales bacterium]|nr:CoA ester lyase [Hyphomicrobiales bacterium]
MRSLLFVPGDSSRKLERGLESGADALILDLEDSVSIERKQAAREMSREFLAAHADKAQRPRLVVRVNALDTGLTDDDLDAVIGARPDAILLPKAEGGPSVTHLDAKLAVREARYGLSDGGIPIFALATETASALFRGDTYAGASHRLKAITWGAEDLSAALGAETNRDAAGNFTAPYVFARTLCLAIAAAAGVEAVDTVYVDFRDDAGFRRECEEARRDGFTAKLAIHPAQVPIINAVFTPSAEAIAHAQAVVDAFAANPEAGVVAIAGAMVDKPHLRQAERILARAGAEKR